MSETYRTYNEALSRSRSRLLNLVRKKLSIWGIACFLVIFSAGAQSPAALAQDASTYYTVMHPDEFDIDWTSFYQEADRRTARTRHRLPHHLDLPYGDHRKQVLDLYLPKNGASDAPVLLFLHGGGFREGDRAQYGFVADPFADRGIITAVASYRLTSDGFGYPAQTDDAKDAVAWLYNNIAKYGGNSSAIYVVGHSAGAILAADLSVDRSWFERRGIPKESLRGFAPVSGPYDLRVSGHPGEADAYAPSLERQIDASPLFHVHDPAPEAVVVVGTEGQEERFQSSSKELVKRLTVAGTDADLLVLSGADHNDTALSIADPSSPLFEGIMSMIMELKVP